MQNQIDPKFQSIALKLIKSRRGVLNFDEVSYVNSLPLDEQLLLIKFSPLAINSIKQQNSIHYDCLLSLSRLPAGIKINMDQCNLDYAKKFTKKCKNLYSNYFINLNNEEIHLIGLKGRSRGHWLRIDNPSEKLKIFVLKDDFYNLKHFNNPKPEYIESAIEGFNPYKSRGAYHYFDTFMNLDLTSTQLKKLYDKIISTKNNSKNSTLLKYKDSMLAQIYAHKNWKNIAELILDTIKQKS